MICVTKICTSYLEFDIYNKLFTRLLITSDFVNFMTLTGAILTIIPYFTAGNNILYWNYFDRKSTFYFVQYIEASDLESETQKENPVRYHEAWQLLCSSNGVLIPGGFGIRGMEGMIMAAKWARANKVPYLGKLDKEILGHSYGSPKIYLFLNYELCFIASFQSYNFI